MQRGSRSPALCRAPGSHRRVGHRGAFASQNLKYMKALNDPYVKALAAHRRELNASRIDLEREEHRLDHLDLLGDGRDIHVNY
ncbi:unnamed protein product [Durusdinium trenchii]|uniref:DUF3563 domain-containing protein n=1 Tax=Durusdinium trenchii TaxID=1381693 RepID=A0ABP0IJW5_9DINO